MSRRKDLEKLKLLGNKKTEYKDTVDPSVLETFENRFPQNDYIVEFEQKNEFTSLCVVGDTYIDVPRNLVELPYGIPIKDLVGKEGYVYSYDRNLKRIVLKKFYNVRQTGEEKVIKLIYTTKYRKKVLKRTLFLTENDQVMLRNGEFIDVSKLKKNDSLMPFIRFYEQRKPMININNGYIFDESMFISNEIYKDYKAKLKDNNQFNLEIQNIVPSEINKQINFSLNEQKYSDRYKLSYKEFREIVERSNYKITLISDILGISVPSVYSLASFFKIDLTKYTLVHIEETKEKVPVYNMEVVDTENYVAEGIIKHNCPKTGQPDFADYVKIIYKPRKKCIESKSLKLYLFSYRNHKDFGEDIANEILNDLVAVADPEWMEVRLKMRPRGGISWETIAKYKRKEELVSKTKE